MASQSPNRSWESYYGDGRNKEGNKYLASTTLHPIQWQRHSFKQSCLLFLGVLIRDQAKLEEMPWQLTDHFEYLTSCLSPSQTSIFPSCSDIWCPLKLDGPQISSAQVLPMPWGCTIPPSSLVYYTERCHTVTVLISK